ncbi:hypothetical protein [Naasia aerilata]|uniref:Tetratricopeptide repeat protein n=1 Tax=Naasia aerilata TaxID=1162966 RepID=A0ABM8GCS9_9MICO|nr:hypothetical protein [Naasia aerilata]BDZ46055.1 hypothetical protein GCM10025866_19640 [Naasia aerilata]
MAALSGDVERAGRLLGAAQTLRERVGLFNPSAFAFHSQLVGSLRSGPGAELFEHGYTEGRGLTPQDAVEEALALTRERPVAVGAQEQS